MNVWINSQTILPNDMRSATTCEYSFSSYDNNETELNIIHILTCKTVCKSEYNLFYYHPQHQAPYMNVIFAEF